MVLCVLENWIANKRFFGIQYFIAFISLLSHKTIAFSSNVHGRNITLSLEYSVFLLKVTKPSHSHQTFMVGRSASRYNISTVK